jgi:excisionase family DNA binding protein
LEVIVIGDQKRVTIESFNTWYANQSDYRKFDELTKEEQEQFIAEHENESLGKVLRMKKEKESKEKFGKEWYSTDEAASILGISKSAVLRLIRSGQLGAEKVNHSLKILKQDIIWYLNPPQIKKEDEIHGVDSD